MSLMPRCAGSCRAVQQSPFLDIFPDQRIRATLQLMSLSPDEHVTRDRALEICQRQGLKAYIAGAIVKV
jgi:hypothetical protein